MDTLIHINSILVCWEDDFIHFLDYWQTLLGAIIGGISGVIAAYIVAWDVRQREIRASALIILNDLLQIISAGEAFKNLNKDKDKQNAAISTTSKMMVFSPKLSPLTEISIFRIAHVDEKLSAHLIHFNRDYNSIIALLETEKKIQEDVVESQRSLTQEGAAQLLKRREIIYNAFMVVYQQALCANSLINSFILGKPHTAFFNRIKRGLGLFSYNDDCSYLLKTGNLKESAQDANGETNI